MPRRQKDLTRTVEKAVVEKAGVEKVGAEKGGLGKEAGEIGGEAI